MPLRITTAIGGWVCCGCGALWFGLTWNSWLLPFYCFCCHPLCINQVVASHLKYRVHPTHYLICAQVTWDEAVRTCGRQHLQPRLVLYEDASHPSVARALDAIGGRK